MNALASNQNKKMMAKGAHGHTDDFDAPDLAQPDNSSGAAAQYDDDGIPIIGNGPSQRNMNGDDANLDQA